jgi:hypothetical protein
MTKNGRIWIRDSHPGSATLVSSVADPDPVHFLPQGSGIRDDFFSGSRILTTSQIQDFTTSQIQDFTFKNGEKQEKLNFV